MTARRPGMSETITKFTLRFHNARTHELLGLVADRYGVSKNQLAEEMLERELEAAALLVERELSSTLQSLREYRRDERLAEDIQAVAEAEVYGADPLKSRAAEPLEVADVFGAMEAFSS
jgi:hypothetical protein